MKRLVLLALVALALAAVPVAFGDNGGPSNGGPSNGAPSNGAPAAPTAPAAQQGAGPHRLALLRLRLHRFEVRFARHCGTAASTAPAECVERAQRAEQRLHNLDGRIKQLIQKIQSTCTATSTDPRCQNADGKIALLQRLDALVQKLAAKLQDWLNA